MPFSNEVYVRIEPPKEFGATREMDAGDPDRPVLWPVTAVPPSVPGPRQEVLELRDPREQADEGGQGTGRARQPHR